MTSSTKTTIDASGRLVIPKAIRDRAGFRAGQVLQLTCRDGRVEIEAAPVPVRIEQHGRVAVAVAEEPLPTLTNDEVERTLEDLRTRRSGE